jgi:uncharacterized protein YggE
MKYRPVLIAAFLASMSVPGLTQNFASIEEMARTPVVTLRISESLRSPPDQASLSISTESKAPTAAAALETNKGKTERLIAAIRAAGVAQKDIQTEGVNISPDYRYDQVNGRGSQRMVGYSASNTVRIKTRRIDRLSNLLDALAAAGADRIYGPNFEIADRAPLRFEARKRAMARGAAEAAEYAANAGFARVRLLSVQEGVSEHSSDIVVTGSRIGGAPPPPPAPPMAERGGDGIQLGQLETGVMLTLQYRMER